MTRGKASLEIFLPRPRAAVLVEEVKLERHCMDALALMQSSSSPAFSYCQVIDAAYLTPLICSDSLKE